MQMQHSAGSKSSDGSKSHGLGWHLPTAYVDGLSVWIDHQQLHLVWYLTRLVYVAGSIKIFNLDNIFWPAFGTVAPTIPVTPTGWHCCWQHLYHSYHLLLPHLTLVVP